MNDPAHPDPAKAEHGSRGSVTLDAVLVPVLVIMIQAVYAATGNGFRNAFLGRIFHPVILLSMALVALASFFALRRFARHKTARRVVCSLRSRVHSRCVPAHGRPCGVAEYGDNVTQTKWTKSFVGNGKIG